MPATYESGLSPNAAGSVPGAATTPSGGLATGYGAVPAPQGATQPSSTSPTNISIGGSASGGAMFR
jgi:hypothetical protein